MFIYKSFGFILSWEPQHLFNERILSLSHELSAMRREGLNQNLLPARLQEEVAERRR